MVLFSCETVMVLLFLFIAFLGKFPLFCTFTGCCGRTMVQTGYLVDAPFLVASFHER